LDYITLNVARNGFLTYARLHKGENIKSLAQKEKLPLKTVQLDVTDDISVKNAIQSIQHRPMPPARKAAFCSGYVLLYSGFSCYACMPFHTELICNCHLFP
jgi:hypothetical protein